MKDLHMLISERQSKIHVKTDTEFSHAEFFCHVHIKYSKYKYLIFMHFLIFMSEIFLMKFILKTFINCNVRIF